MSSRNATSNTPQSKINQHLNRMQSRSWDLLYWRMILTHRALEAEVARAHKGQSACAQAYTALWGETLNQQCCCDSAT